MRSAVLLALLPLLSGCHLLHLGAGQLKILSGRVPIEEVIADGDHTWTELEKLRVVLAARQFGFEQCGLEETGAYLSFYDTKGRSIVTQVSASEADAFAAYEWWFPLVGNMPYKGWFDPAPAVAEGAELAREGLDVCVLPVAAYSSLGWFDDPFYSGLLDKSEGEIADLVLHEMTHTTVFSGDADWNENVATFVGEEGARRFFLTRGGPTDRALPQHERDMADERVIHTALRGLRGELWRVYESSGPRPEKLRRKQEQIDAFRAALPTEVAPHLSDGMAGVRGIADPRFPLNNAFLLAIDRYRADQDLFRELLRGCGNDMPSFLAVLRVLARSDEPRAATIAWVKGEPPP